mmetsp:Transcript_751/g.1510  ORF Transcript_751/g.1510 Transcript_751/m.1510 type:complete len:368 (-) Transcript_751:150-1253(-)
MHTSVTFPDSVSGSSIGLDTPGREQSRVSSICASYRAPTTWIWHWEDKPWTEAPEELKAAANTAMAGAGGDGDVQTRLMAGAQSAEDNARQALADGKAADARAYADQAANLAQQASGLGATAGPIQFQYQGVVWENQDTYFFAVDSNHNGIATLVPLRRDWLVKNEEAWTKASRGMVYEIEGAGATAADIYVVWNDGVYTVQKDGGAWYLLSEEGVTYELREVELPFTGFYDVMVDGHWDKLPLEDCAGSIPDGIEARLNPRELGNNERLDFESVSGAAHHMRRLTRTSGSDPSSSSDSYMVFSRSITASVYGTESAPSGDSRYLVSIRGSDPISSSDAYPIPSQSSTASVQHHQGDSRNLRSTEEQ